MQKADIYVFTGTGNTLIAARALAGALKEAGVETRMLPMENSNPADIDTEAVIGIAVPVAFQSTYPLCWDFISCLPETKGTGVFLIDTLAQISGGIVGPVKKILKSKGYNPLGAVEIKMPSNFYRSEPKGQKDLDLIEKGKQQAKDFGRNLAEGKAEWPDQGAVGDLLAWIGRGALIKFFISMTSKGLKVFKDDCVKCGLCAKLCPTGNITMDPYPVFGRKCQLCMRCAGVCPKGAIIALNVKNSPYLGVKTGELENFTQRKE